jgi:hypothetical protein
MKTRSLLFLAALTLPSCAPALESTDPPTACTPGETEPCYSADSEARDVGTCRAGARACAPDGSGFGACEGEVLPQLESCGSFEDVACDGETWCSGNPTWKLIRDGSEPQGIAASSDGESVLFGWTPSGALFVQRVTADGSSLWTRTFDGFGASERAGGIAMTEAHEAIVVIHVLGSITLEGQTIDASPEGALALRFADDGAPSAVKLLDLSGPPALLPPVPRVARLTPGGGVTVGGDGFLALLDADLETTSHHRYEGDITFADIAVGPGDTTFAAGSYMGTFEPGGLAQDVFDNHAGFLVELDGAEIVWSQTLGGDVETNALSLLVRADGTLRIAGTQAGGGSLIDYLGVEGWTAFVADRNELGLLDSTYMGWGPRRPESITIDLAGDVVTRAMGSDEWSMTAIFKGNDTGNNVIHWAQMFEWPPVSVTLPSGETIAATKLAVQKLAR